MTLTSRTNLALLVLRLGVGLIAIYFGAQQMLGLFGGLGLHETVERMKYQNGFPPAVAVALIGAELVGGLLVLLGCLTGVGALGVACNMAASGYLEWQSPGLAQSLMTKGSPAIASQAFFAPAIFLSSVAILLMGAGQYSLDAKLFKPKKKKAK